MQGGVRRQVQHCLATRALVCRLCMREVPDHLRALLGNKWSAAGEANVCSGQAPTHLLNVDDLASLVRREVDPVTTLHVTRFRLRATVVETRAPFLLQARHAPFLRSMGPRQGTDARPPNIHVQIDVRLNSVGPPAESTRDGNGTRRVNRCIRHSALITSLPGHCTVGEPSDADTSPNTREHSQHVFSLSHAGSAPRPASAGDRT